jgi:prophage antirepressor-like protein
MTDIADFIFEDSPVRVIDRDGEPWFVLADVCKVLEIGNPTRAAERLDPEEKNTLTIDDTQRFAFGLRAGNPTMNVVSESGLYALVLTSRKAEAKAFKRWLTREVLPAIRRTGSYRAPVAAVDVNDSETLIRLLLAHQQLTSIA